MRALPLVLLLLAFSPQDRRPNVLIIITDDQGYGDLGCHGNPKIMTPNIDGFATAAACQMEQLARKSYNLARLLPPADQYA